jgi:hypothetical protein
MYGFVEDFFTLTQSHVVSLLILFDKTRLRHGMCIMLIFWL